MTEKLLKNHAERGRAQSTVCLQTTWVPLWGMGPGSGLRDPSVLPAAPWLWVVAWGCPGLPPVLPVTHGLEQRLTLPMRNAWDARSAHCLVNAGLLAACPQRRRNFSCSLVTLPITDRMQ